MKSILLRGALLGLSCPVLSSPPAAHGSPPPADSVHFCAFDDYEQWRRDHPRPAAKRLADLNAGEPRTVRMIYSLPNDRPFREEVVDSMKTVIGQVQTFYAEQMQANGYGNKTFRIETDAQGEPLVHRVDGQHPASHYDNTYGAAMLDEIHQTFDRDANIYLIVIDNGKHSVGDSAGRGNRRGKNGGFAWVAGNFGWELVVHELGHAFGLQHDFRDGAYIMSYGPGWDGLSACAAEYLAVHPYFNADSPIEEGSPPTIELVSPTEYPVGSKSVSIQLEVSDPEGVHQVILFVSGSANIEVKACSGATNEKDAVVEFEYDGVIPSDGGTSLSNPISHTIIVEAVDTDGNVRQELYGLAEMSPYYIATLEGHTDLVRSVAFSPDGTLASGSWDGTAKLWNTETRKQIATLSQGSTDSRVVSVAFSPNGEILAVVSSVLGLWNVATKQQIATLRGEGQPYSVAFSPDGTLATGLWNGTIELWDVGTKRQIATLKGHTQWVRSVSFSQDGTLLASGSNDGIIRLWDVMAREQIATLKGHRFGVGSVALSPDETMLASGSGDRTVKLWDVATRQNIATLEGHTHWVEAVSFLPDGTLISGDARGTIKLWNVATQEQIAGFGHGGGVHSVAFSPDGGILASGSGVGTITLWDMQLLQSRPQTLTRISGIEQQGPAGAALLEPFVVEVRDQNGNPLEGATVTFAVTGGGGTLSSTTATTDANGRAAATLTLGREPETVTVVATVAGLDPVTFTATAEATPDFNGDGKTDFVDFFLFADAYGGTDSRFDLDGSGTVDFVDFFKFVDAFDQPGQAKLLAMARELIGLPLETQLQQNWPNPFNSETAISWFLLRPGAARVEVFALTGQRVAVLQQGSEKAGRHRVHWDGRDDEGRPLASGVYLYRLVTSEAVLTRKLTLLR